MLTRLSNGPHIVRLLDTYLCKVTGQRVLVLERHEQFSFRKKRTLAEIGLIFDQLFDVRRYIDRDKGVELFCIQAVAFVHSKDLIHLDLKWENVLWDDRKKAIVLTDFDHALDKKGQRFLYDNHAGTEGMSPSSLLHAFH